MKWQRHLKNGMSGVCLLIIPYCAFAVTSGVSVGTVASNLTSATDVFSAVFSAVFYVIGITLVVASVMRYRDYRQNPSQTPISRVWFLLIAGLAIGFFPLMINFLSGATSYLNV